VSRPALLDVNVIVALFDPDHLHHESAHRWFVTHRASGWATCPLTENAAVRILSSPAYSPIAERPTAIAKRLRTFRESGHHRFWPDDVSLCERSLYALDIAHRHLTDAYLLGLAVRHDGRLATFDRSVPLKAVPEARQENLTIIEA
jgi:uncharacterized protein